MRALTIAVTALALVAIPAQAQMGGKRHSGDERKGSRRPRKSMRRAYKAALERIPEPKEKYDPWGVTKPAADPAKGFDQEAETDSLRLPFRYPLASPDGSRMRMMPCLFVVLLLVATPVLGWDHWGGRPGGTRFSPINQINPANVGNLVQAWEFHTGDLDSRPPAAMARTKFEATPLFVEDSLVLCSPFNEIIALDPAHRRAEVALRSEDQQRAASRQPLQLPRRRALGRRPGRGKYRLPRPDIHGHQRCPGDRGRRQNRHALRRFRRQRRGQARRSERGCYGRANSRSPRRR